MAWWVDALYQTMQTGDIVSHDLLNAIQQAIVDIGGGGKSLKKLTVDGVGRVATTVADGFASVLKGIVIPGGADGDTAFDVTGTPSTRRRVLSIATGGPRLRLFITPTQAELTFNADYDGTTSPPWQRDSADLAGRLVISTGGPLASAALGVEWFDASAMATWNTADWVKGISTRRGRLITGGTAPAVGEVNLGIGLGAGASTISITGNDTAGSVTFQTGAMPATVAAVTIPLKDGAYPSGSVPIVCYGAHQVTVSYPALAGEVSGGNLVIGMVGTITPNQSYTLNWWRAGI